MKNNILISLLLMAFALSSIAQEKEQETVQDFRRHEVSIGYGFHPVTSISVDRVSRFDCWMDKVGAIYGSYTYYFNKHVGLGGTYCFDPREIDYRHHGNSFNPNVANLYESSHSIMGHLKLNCISLKHFVLYTKFGAGISFWGYRLKEFQPELYEVNPPDQHCCFAWQAALGIEVGNDRIAGFIQGGLGMEGLFSIGIRYKFNNK